jgi:hypothetical protein
MIPAAIQKVREKALFYDFLFFCGGKYHLLGGWIFCFEKAVLSTALVAVVYSMDH